MKNIEHVRPQAKAMTADFERERGAQLAHDDKVTAYIVFTDLIYNYPRPLSLRVLVNRYEEEDGFSEQIAAEALGYWESRAEG